MDACRRLGIGIVMIIPSFIGAGAVWDFFNNWGAVSAWIAFIIGVYGVILYKARQLNRRF